MRSSAPAYLIDWIVVSLRWLTLFGLAVSLGSNTSFSLPVILTLLIAAIWNISLTMLAALNRRLPAHRQVCVAGDMLIAYLLFYLSGMLGSSLEWSGLLPLITASIYFQFSGALLVSLLNVLAQGFLALTVAPLTPVLVFVITLLPVYLAVGILLSYLVRRMGGILSKSQKTESASRKVSERSGQDRQKMIYNLVSTLSATINYQKVLEAALDLSANALSTTTPSTNQLASAVLLFSENENHATELHLGSARRFPPSDLRITVPGTSGLIGRAIDEGLPRLSKDIPKDPELTRFIALQSCKSAYCLPLRTGLEAYGILLFAHPESDFFGEDQREILDIVGNQSVIALQNARLYQDLEQEKERMLEIQEEARKKMARDLHDGPTQSVAAIAMRVNFARRLIERDPKAASEELFKIEDLARRTTKEIRHMLFTLRPLVLESQGLVPALESMAEKMRETYNQNVIIQADQTIANELEVGKQAVVFYIAEEAVNNARKHARASNIWVRLKSLEDDLALLEVQDDGVGFNINAVSANYENRGSLGMVNMRERTELVNGVMRVDSAEGRGTRIQVFIPLSEVAADRIRRGV